MIRKGSSNKDSFTRQILLFDFVGSFAKLKHILALIPQNA